VLMEHAIVSRSAAGSRGGGPGYAG
jgi:hypothetical protein